MPAPTLTRRPLFLQGTVAVPVKTPAEDFRLNYAGLFVPDGADALKARSGILWGPGSTSAFTPCQVVAGSGQLTVKPGRLVMQATTANQGEYEAALEADTVRTIAGAAVGAGLPTAGNFKAGRVIARLYDQLYGDVYDGWDVEVHLGASAATANGAALPALPTTGAYLELRTFTVDSAGAVTLTGTQKYTSVYGPPLPCTVATRPTNPWVGQEIEERDTLFHRRWDGTRWEILRYLGSNQSNNGPAYSLVWTNAVLAHNVSTGYSSWTSQIGPGSAWATAGDGGVPLLQYQNTAGASIICRAKGRVRVACYHQGDSSVPRISRGNVTYSFVNGALAGSEDSRLGWSGFAGAGYLSWFYTDVVAVNPGDVIGFIGYQFSNPAQANTYTTTLTVHYL